MKNTILLVLSFFLIPIIINGQTQEATTSDGKKVILNPDGTWKYAEEVTTSDGKKVILNVDGTWKYADVKKDSKNRGEGSGLGDKGVSYDLAGRSVQRLPLPEYNYQGGGRVVVEVSVDRSGKVTQAVSGIKGSTTLDEYLLKVAREASLEAQFDPNPNAPFIQRGSITYSFIIK